MTRPITQSTLTVNGIDLKTPRLIDPPPRVTRGEKPDRLTVACVWWGSLYGADYVAKLRSAVARHLTVPHDFVCITPHKKVPDGVHAIPPAMPVNAEGWWQKVGLFAPNLFSTSDRVLYLDLDVVIINSLDALVSATDPFCMIENYGPNKGHAAHNSSVMLWTPSTDTWCIFDGYSPDVSKKLHGDQCWIWRVMRHRIANFEKHEAVSYKYEKMQPQWRHKNEKTSIVVFHGNPKPHQVKDPEIVRNWK